MNRQSSKTPLEHQRLLRLAREYSKAGYRVSLYPKAEALPEVLQDCLIALLAQGDHETVVADVRSRSNLTLNGAADLRRLVAKVEALPGWQFDLVVTNPRFESDGDRPDVAGRQASTASEEIFLER